MRLITSIVISLFFAASCAAPNKSWDRIEAEKATVRLLTGVNKDIVLEAAEKLFRLADPDDVTFEFPTNELRVQRSFFAYYVVASTTGSYKWVVQAMDVPTGAEVRISAYLDSQNSTATISPVLGGSGIAIGTTSASSTKGVYIQESLLYELFWDRLRYLTGLQSEWTSCLEAEANPKVSKLHGTLDALCLNADDNTPQ